MAEDEKDKSASSTSQPSRTNPISDAYNSIKGKLEERRVQQLESRKMKAQDRIDKLAQEREAQKLEEQVMDLEKEQRGFKERKNQAFKQKIDDVLSPLRGIGRGAPQQRAQRGSRRAPDNRGSYIAGHEANRIIFQGGDAPSNLILGSRSDNAARLLMGDNRGSNSARLLQGSGSSNASRLVFGNQRSGGSSLFSRVSGMKDAPRKRGKSITIRIGRR